MQRWLNYPLFLAIDGIMANLKKIQCDWECLFGVHRWYCRKNLPHSNFDNNLNFDFRLYLAHYHLLNHIRLCFWLYCRCPVLSRFSICIHHKMFGFSLMLFTFPVLILDMKTMIDIQMLLTAKSRRYHSLTFFCVKTYHKNVNPLSWILVRRTSPQDKFRKVIMANCGVYLVFEVSFKMSRIF